ncbi:DUF4265 domain-containing protein [Salmonella enterica subsp. enterica]|nr:DUF4265 domain-containing protein [Salmonella enterica subsp. enterica]
MECVYFYLVVEEDYPPVSTESVWAEKLSSGNYRIKNIPFYTKDVSLDDVVSVKKGQDGELLFHRVVRHSGNSTLRVVFFEEIFTHRVIRKLENMGCSWENMSGSLYSINVPCPTKTDVVIDYLEKKFSMEILDYECGKLNQ